MQWLYQSEDLHSANGDTRHGARHSTLNFCRLVFAPRHPPPRVEYLPGMSDEKPARFDPNYVAGMSHFYRGEVGRIMSWRGRLDSTTNWAITSTSTIFTVAFSIERVPHIIFLFNVAIVLIMLWIEGRRYRFYDAFRARVRMLEAHFLVPLIMQDAHLLQGDWRKMLSEDLLLPSFKISTFQAVGRRLKRNYVFIFMVILVAWVTKIFLHAQVPITDFSSFYNALRVGASIPSWLVAFFFFATFLATLATTVYFWMKSENEFYDFGNKKHWDI